MFQTTNQLMFTRVIYEVLTQFASHSFGPGPSPSPSSSSWCCSWLCSSQRFEGEMPCPKNRHWRAWWKFRWRTCGFSAAPVPKLRWKKHGKIFSMTIERKTKKLVSQLVARKSIDSRCFGVCVLLLVSNFQRLSWFPGLRSVLLFFFAGPPSNLTNANVQS